MTVPPLRSAALALALLRRASDAASSTASNGKVQAIPSSSSSQKQRRRLGPFGSLGGYEFETHATSLAYLDLDMRSFDGQLDEGTKKSFAHAKDIYTNGGHSGPYAVLDLDRALESTLTGGSDLEGLTDTLGNEMFGTVVGDYFGGEGSVNVLYPLPFDPRDWDVREMCMIGGLASAREELGLGCYSSEGTITVDGAEYTYTYDALKDTYAHTTLATFSLLSQRLFYKPSEDCPGCPYPEFVQFQEYYEDMSYGHHWVLGALAGTPVHYVGRGDADFTGMSYKARAEAAKKGAVNLNVHMAVIGLLRRSLGRCSDGPRCDEGIVDRDGNPCEDEPETEWDNGAALYFGSLEGPQGGSGMGHFLYRLADDRCADFKTCGPGGDATEGTSRVNDGVLAELTMGQRRISSRACNRAEFHIERIWQLMSVPIVQSVLRYAHELDDKTTRGGKAASDEEMEKRSAEGATFAAALLPRINACNPADAEVLYGLMRVGAVYTSFEQVKNILQANYECLGITCEDVGGYYDKKAGTYHPGAEPCGGTYAAGARSGSSGSGGGGRPRSKGTAAGIVIGSLFGFGLLVIGVLYAVRWFDGKEKPDPVVEDASTPVGGGEEVYV